MFAVRLDDVGFLHALDLDVGSGEIRHIAGGGVQGQPRHGDELGPAQTQPVDWQGAVPGQGIPLLQAQFHQPLTQSALRFKWAQGFATLAADQMVAPRTPDAVEVGPAQEHVVSAPARHPVRADSPVDPIVAASALDAVVALVAVEYVLARIAGHAIIAGTADQFIIVAPAFEAIVAGPAFDLVVSVLPLDPVPTRSARDPVIAVAAPDAGRDEPAIDINQGVGQENLVVTVAAPDPDLSHAVKGRIVGHPLDAGDYDAAAEAFEALEKDAEGEAKPDLAFAAAVARNRAGERGVALDALNSLLERCPQPGEAEERRKISRAERELDPTAVLQSWVRNYREQSFADYRAGRLTAVLSLQGCDLAVETVAALEAAPPVEAVPAVREAAPPAPQAAPAAEAPAVRPDQSEAPAGSDASDDAAQAPSGGLGIGTILLVAGILIVLGWLWRRS